MLLALVLCVIDVGGGACGVVGVVLGAVVLRLVLVSIIIGAGLGVGVAVAVGVVVIGGGVGRCWLFVVWCVRVCVCARSLVVVVCWLLSCGGCCLLCAVCRYVVFVVCYVLCAVSCVLFVLGCSLLVLW